MQLSNRSRLLLCLIIPLAIWAMVVHASNARGPFYLGGNNDPDYCYLLNGINLLNGNQPEHTDHPGTTLQIYTAVGLKILGCFRSGSDLANDVLTNPEWFLHWLQRGLLAGFCLSSAVLGVIVLKRTHLLFLAMLIQAVPFFSSEVIVTLARFFPENLSLTLINMLFCAILGRLEPDGPESDETLTHAAIFGVLAAGIMITKILGAPLAILPLFVLRKLRNQLAYVVCTAAAAAVMLIPVYSRFSVMVFWVKTNAQHTGRYGQGPPGFLNLPEYIANLSGIFSKFPALTILAISLAGYFLLTCFSKPQAGWNPRRLLLGIVLADVAILAVVSKFPAPHYLMPVLATCGISFYLMGHALLAHFPSLRNPKYSTPVLIFLCVIIAAGAYLGRKRIERETPQANAAIKVAAYVDQFASNGSIIAAYRSSSQAYALAFGNSFAGYRFTTALQRLYPRYFDYNIWGNALSRFRMNTSPEDIQLLCQSTLVHGTDLTPDKLAGILKLLSPAVTCTALPDQAGEHFYLLNIAPSDPR